MKKWRQNKNEEVERSTYARNAKMKSDKSKVPNVDGDILDISIEGLKFSEDKDVCLNPKSNKGVFK